MQKPISDLEKEQVILVNEQDIEIGSANKLEAHEKGLLHRAFSVFIFRKLTKQYELLLQQRHPKKYHGGGLWTNTCCSHPRLQEPVFEAAHRRLAEEMGFQVPLTWVGQFCYRAVFSNGMIEHELDHVLIGFYEKELIVPNPVEVSAYRWVALDTLQAQLTADKAHFSPWLPEALTLALKHLTNLNLEKTSCQ